MWWTCWCVSVVDVLVDVLAFGLARGMANHVAASILFQVAWLLGRSRGGPRLLCHPPASSLAWWASGIESSSGIP